MSKQSDEQQLVALLAERSAKRGDFVLSSGRRSNLYIDARLTALSPEGLLLVGRLGLQALRASGWQPESVGGLTMGADPIAYAIALTSAIMAEQNNGEMVRAFTVRKEPKAHGTGQQIEGPFRAGDRAVVVEDVITSGGSALKAIEAVQRAGGNVVGVLALVDREEGGRQAIESLGFAVISLVRAADILAQLP